MECVVYLEVSHRNPNVEICQGLNYDSNMFMIAACQD
jgi:hypothetical protein